MTTNENAPVANLREAKKESAQARKQSASKPAPAKKVPAKAPGSGKQPDKPAVANIKWSPTEDRDEHGNCESVGTIGDREYHITRSGDRLAGDGHPGRQDRGDRRGRQQQGRVEALRRSLQGSAPVIAALAVAVIGRLLAVVAVLVGVHRLTK